MTLFHFIHFFINLLFFFCCCCDVIQDDNMNIQVGATFAMMAILFCWFGYWFYAGLNINPSSIPAIGSDMTTVLGVVLFNYTCACDYLIHVNAFCSSCLIFVP